MGPLRPEEGSGYYWPLPATEVTQAGHSLTNWSSPPTQFWEVLIDYFLLLRHGPQKIKGDYDNSYSFPRIRCRGNVFTPLLPSSRTVA
jgi:hypothetical protein